MKRQAPDQDRVSLLSAKPEDRTAIANDEVEVMQQQQTSLTVPDDLMTELTRVARHTGRSEGAVLREAIEAYLRDLEAPVVESLGSISDPGLNARDVRSWLDRNFEPR